MRTRLHGQIHPFPHMPLVVSTAVLAAHGSVLLLSLSVASCQKLFGEAVHVCNRARTTRSFGALVTHHADDGRLEYGFWCSVLR